MTPSPRPSIPSTASDLELLRRFEPIIHYTKGEQFYPTSVDRYIRTCGLYAHYPDGRDEAIVPEGQLTPDRFVEPRSAEFGTVQYLRLIGPLNLAESAQALRERARLKRDPQNKFRGGQGRLARVGYVSRLIDAGFSLTLLLRGRVPGAIAAAAETTYQKVSNEQEDYVYHGRVVRQNGWVALQYWFFFFYNSWRSGFHGINDHESDWEMCLIYLYPDGDELVPEWAAFASHDFHGDDLRRRWDDTEELESIDGHPVIYAGAGSHASYFRRGEYQTDVTPPLPGWLNRAAIGWKKFWTATLGQDGSSASFLRIPFVDYARGDGLSIGPDQAKAWTPAIIDDETPWVSQYRGLWGLFAKDPISGENAPAGPMYNRDGTVRAAWYDPLGFAGLDKVPPPPLEPAVLAQRIEEIDAQQAELLKQIEAKSRDLQELGGELEALKNNPHLARRHATLTKNVETLANEVKSLRRQRAENGVLRESLTLRLKRLQAGQRDNPRAHIQHLGTPASPRELRFNRLAEGWAALSVSLLLILVVALLIFAPTQVLGGLVVLAVVFVLLESIFRGTFTSTVTTIALVLALIASGVLIVTFWWQILVVGFVAAGALLLWENIRELID